MLARTACSVSSSDGSGGASANAARSTSVTDSDGGPASDSITVSVTNSAPTADSQNVSTNEDTSLSITLTGDDPEGDSLTFQLVSQPANGTLSGSAPNVTYTPDQDYNGADSFRFTVNDGQLTSSAATVSISVAAVNDAPVADNQTVTTDEDTAASITLVANDVDDDPLTYTIGQPSNGTLTGTGPDVLARIDRVGSDLGYQVGTCGKDGQGVPVEVDEPVAVETDLSGVGIEQSDEKMGDGGFAGGTQSRKPHGDALLAQQFLPLACVDQAVAAHDITADRRRAGQSVRNGR